ncbi:hypothetical protein [Achromobacter phage shaaii_LB5]|nr:hypothetical protein [Achromobacter phage shaaii_LB5]
MKYIRLMEATVDGPRSALVLGSEIVEVTTALGPKPPNGTKSLVWRREYKEPLAVMDDIASIAVQLSELPDL